MNIKQKLKLRDYLMRLGFKAPIFGHTYYLASPWYEIAMQICNKNPVACEGITIKKWEGKGET